MILSRIELLLLCLITAACDQPQVAEPLETHAVATPILKDVNYSHEYVAKVHSMKYVEVRSKVKGYLDKIHVDEGQPVEKGCLLFELDPAEFQQHLLKAEAAYKSAAADLKAAQLDLQNVKRLFDKNIVAEAEYLVAKAKVESLHATAEQALADKHQAELQLSFTQIRAPYTGIINRIPNKTGSLIAEGDMLTSISDNREVFAYFNLSESDYFDYVAGGEQHAHAVRMRLANDDMYRHAGTVETVESEFDQDTGNIAFRARFPNPDNLLKHGANTKIIVDKQLQNALLVPQKSTFEIQDKLYVFVVDAEGTLHQRHIAPKMRLPDYYAIDSGLSKDEQFLFEGAENRRDGDKIQPLPTDLKTAMADEKQTQPEYQLASAAP